MVTATATAAPSLALRFTLAASEASDASKSPLGRSSHSISAVGRLGALVFSGEHEPRVPIDNTVHVFDTVAKKWSVASSASSESANDTTKPSARVGHSAAAHGDKLYVIAGRSGVGTSQGLAEMDLWAFDVKSGTWSVVHRQDSSTPGPRSYAAMVAGDDHLYLFGGVGAEGRTSDLHAFGPLSSGSPQWTELSSSAPFSVRGGPGLALLDDHLVLYGGFNGQELGDVHVWKLGGTEWVAPKIHGTTEPGPRSVLGFAPLTVATSSSGKENVLLAIYGERDPSPYGHVGAGKYHDDVWALRIIPGTTPSAEWIPCDLSSSASKPSGRGWWAATSVPAEGKKGEFETVLCHGGFDGKDRLGDLWELRQA